MKGLLNKNLLIEVGENFHYPDSEDYTEVDINSILPEIYVQDTKEDEHEGYASFIDGYTAFRNGCCLFFYEKDNDMTIQCKDISVFLDAVNVYFGGRNLLN